MADGGIAPDEPARRPRKSDPTTTLQFLLYLYYGNLGISAYTFGVELLSS